MPWRRVLLTTHLWAGFAAAPFFLVLGLTGAAMVFENEITDLANAKLFRVQGGGPVLALDELEARMAAAHPGYRVVGVEYPPDDRHAYGLDLAAPGGKDDLSLFVDQHTGRVLGSTADGRNPMGWVHQLHTHLLAGRTGQAVVGVEALVLMLLAASGLVLWWPGKVFTVKRDGTAKRLVFDLHSATGVWAWIFLLIFAVTGAVIHWDGPTARFLARATGSAPLAAIPRGVPDCAGEAALPAGRLVAAAAAAAPGASPSWLQLGPDGGMPARMVLRYPEDHTPAGRTQVFLASCTGRVLAVRSTRTMPAAYRYAAMWNREVHTGDLFGWPSRIVMCLFSLSLPVMALTGPLIWWTRRRRP